MNSQILIKINNFIKNRLIEFLGILLVFVSIFLLASIVSYSPSDPNFIYTPENTEIKNVGGFYGSVISDFLLQSLGLISIFLVFNFFYWGIKLTTRKTISNFITKIFFVFSYTFAENIYNFLVEPYANAVKDDGTNRRLIFTALQETFITYLKVAFFAAVFISSPIILTQIWKFIAPGLYKNEKRTLLPYLIATPTLFLLGGMLVYYLVMPLMIKFFLSFETSAQINSLPIQLEPKVNEYLSLIMRLIFAFGISFQLPVLLSLLARVGFIDSEYLKKRRKYVIVIIFILAAILTPPDPITQIGLGIPLLILYELSILSVKIVEKRKKDA